MNLGNSLVVWLLLTAYSVLKLLMLTESDVFEMLFPYTP
jgi:hypothetical protein